MRRGLRASLLAALETDLDARLVEGLWQTRCLHCRTRLTVAADGEPLGASTLEHVVPRSWFGQRAAAPLTVRVERADAPANLAVACARCNQQKGRGADAAGPSDSHAYGVVANLLDRRLRRFKERKVPE